MQVMNSNIPSNTPIVKHLDSCYRRRWELYYTPNKVYDSREVNWKDIPINEVYSIESYIEGQIHTVDNYDSGFVSFIRWRFGGQEWIDGEVHKIDVWCIGWTDGVTCFMKEIEFKDGSMTEKEYPFDQFKKHLCG